MIVAGFISFDQPKRNPIVKRYEKENYITVGSKPERWKHHANVKIIEDWKHHIKGNVLDIGCNHGACSFWLNHFGNVDQTEGLDLNKEALIIAQNTFKERGLTFEYHTINLVQEKLDKQFDTLVSFHTLEHIHKEDIKPFLKNACDMLKQEGFFIISIPYWIAWKDQTHVSFFKEEHLIEAMETAGFKTVQCFKDDRWEQKNLLTGIFQK